MKYQLELLKREKYGIAIYAKLSNLLIENNRLEDLKRANIDEDFRELLFKEFRDKL